MSTKTIKAIEVQENQAVTKIVCPAARFGYRNQGIRKHGGRWPTVVKASYREDGERGLPTVYLTLSDDLSGTFPLDPDDRITVEVTGR